MGYTRAVGNRTVGVLRGQDLPAAKVNQWADSADTLYAADGAALPLIDAGFSPVVVGDFDSLRGHSLPDGVRSIHRPDQDFTDCDKLLSVAAEDGVSDITLVGIEGDRLDHMLATLSSAVRSSLRIRLGLRRGLGWIIRPGRSCLPIGSAGRRCSVLPLLPCRGVSLTGVRWPLKDAELGLDGPVSISNHAVEDLQISIEEGAALLIVEHKPQELPKW